MNNNQTQEITLKKAVEMAGGRKIVADACGKLSQEAVRKWLINGLPRTEWTGETNYIETIISLVNEKHPEIELSKTDLLSKKAA